MFKKVFSFFQNNAAPHDAAGYWHKRAQIENEFIEREAQAGAAVFGSVPSGRERKFFCLDTHTWIWHEKWRDENRQPREFTVTYTVRQDGIFKSLDGSSLTKLHGQELQNFDSAVRSYYENVVTKVYGRTLAQA